MISARTVRNTLRVEILIKNGARMIRTVEYIVTNIRITLAIHDTDN